MAKVGGAFLRWGVMGSPSKCSYCSCAFSPSPLPTWRSQKEPHSTQCHSRTLNLTTAMPICSRIWRDPGSAPGIPSQTETAEEGLPFLPQGSDRVTTIELLTTETGGHHRWAPRKARAGGCGRSFQPGISVQIMV